MAAAALATAGYLALGRPGSAGQISTPSPTVIPTVLSSPTPAPTPLPGSLAQQVVSEYWSDISIGEIKLAYGLLTVEARISLTLATFQHNVQTFLQAMGSVKAVVGGVSVSGRQATVTVTLHAASPANDLRTFQRLLWEGGTWRISEASAGSTSP